MDVNNDFTAVKCYKKVYTATQKVTIEDLPDHVLFQKNFEFPRFRSDNDSRQIYWQLRIVPLVVKNPDPIGSRWLMSGFYSEIGAFATERPEDDADVDPANFSVRHVQRVSVESLGPGGFDKYLDVDQPLTFRVNAWEEASRERHGSLLPPDDPRFFEDLRGLTKMEVECTIEYVDFVTENAMVAAPHPVDLVAADYLRLFASGDGADYFFLLDGGKRVPVHKSILTARSAFFRDMHTFTDPDSCGITELPMPDVRPEVMGEMLRFIYAGVTRDDLSAEEAKELLKIADKFDLVPLVNHAGSVLARHISVDVVCEYLLLADFYYCPPLKRHCLRAIRRCFDDLSQRAGWADLLHDALVAEVNRFVSG